MSETEAGQEAGGPHIEIGVHTHWQAGPLTLHGDTMISLWISMGIIIFLAALVRAGLAKDPKAKPSGIQAFAEQIILGLKTIPEGRIGPKWRIFFPVVATLFIFVVVSNWLGVVPLTPFAHVFLGGFIHHIPELGPPTADLNTTVALALVVFLSTHFFGFKTRGFKYFKHFIEPYPFFLPLNLLEELSRPLSLSVRLFGNMFGKEVILTILTALVSIPLFYTVPLLALALLIGFIQAFIFSLLATFYISGAIEGHGGH